MSAKEMHALEKAALDDPFLADALEGYAAVPVNAANDIALLHEKINKRVNAEAKVVPMKSAGIPWLRIAALFIVIIGAGLLTYRFVFSNNNNEVAKSETTSDKQLSPAASDTNLKTKEQETAEAARDSSKSNSPIIKNEEGVTGRTDNLAAREKGKKDYKQDTSSVTNALVSAPDNLEVASTHEEVEFKKVEDDAVASKVARAKPGIDKSASAADTKSKEFINTDSEKLEEESKKRKQQNFTSNIFRGQVLDANNTPLPFANVTNTKDNVGTYTDVKGYFTLISPDSALNVQVHSVGFENANTQLQNNVSSNAIVLQQDLKNIPSTTVSNKKVNTERVRQSTMVLEEPEPYDGWYNYDTYIANNINLPDDVKQKNTSKGEVELSFDVSKNGEPINIKVEKSVCKECDEEAIRLLKEGPKWKKKKKNSRARLNVPF